jgi:hypothetical protein
MPTEELDSRFSDPRAQPMRWDHARALLRDRMVYWLSTVRRDHRPHVTSIVAVWFDDTLCFTTGESEQKARNLEANQAIVITTGSHELEGADVVLEGDARRITDPDRLRRLAKAYIDKYGDTWRFAVRGGRLELEEGGSGEVLAFAIVKRKGFGFAKGEHFGQTRWRFSEDG